jgi:hypothetical protein
VLLDALGRFAVGAGAGLAETGGRMKISFRSLPPLALAGVTISPLLDSTRLGGVGRCIEAKLREITVPPFEGDGTVRLTLNTPYDTTRTRRWF